MLFYPLLFKPIFKERIWGGIKLKEVLNKSFYGSQIGESWELSTVENDISVVANGAFEGLNLNQLIEKYPTELLGVNSIQHFGNNFPLLFKFIDAKEDLSIQVHPNDALAKERHNSFGKTEIWFVMQADDNARLVVGFKDKTNKKEYQEHLENKTLISVLNETPVKAGDAFFLETGTVHAIGAGVLIAEIQQTSDITYRLYDWDRVDANGVGRELHTDLALDAINFEPTNTKLDYEVVKNKSVNLVECSFFKTNILQISDIYNWKKTKESFTVLMCTEGSFTINMLHFKAEFKKGDTILIPAIIDSFEIIGEATLLEITI
ncbi:type I phosphomannose isomerase catalytic subunit [Flavobacterium sp.]|jgi:mannose-6-phosphate isomerase|uniref:type I phosphomannose isomerase catalytic subunit n=1 Tax=Flavobacterium sp. TaxID=239 RepID=UPI0037BE965A